jgi:hypothetical protein
MFSTIQELQKIVENQNNQINSLKKDINDIKLKYLIKEQFN